VDDALYRGRTEAAALTEPARREQTPPLDVRVGSSTNAVRPILVGERHLGAGPQQWVGLGSIAIAAVIADQLTKQVVARTLALGEEVEIAGPFSIHHVHNSGIAFGLFSSATSVVIALTALAVLWMLVFFARSGARHPVLPVALGLVLGGSVANLLDRVRLGHVTDFLDFRFWPAFNLADLFIVVGVASLFGALAGADRSKRRPGPLGNSPLSRP
jgi:signal peptidase II